MGYVLFSKNKDGSYNMTPETNLDGPYCYIEHRGDTLPIWFSGLPASLIKPIMWAQDGQYGWISKEQVQNLRRRQMDLNKQQKGYTKDRPINLVFYWDEIQILDPVTIKLIREVVDGN